MMILHVSKKSFLIFYVRAIADYTQRPSLTSRWKLMNGKATHKKCGIELQSNEYGARRTRLARHMERVPLFLSGTRRSPSRLALRVSVPLEN